MLIQLIFRLFQEGKLNNNIEIIDGGSSSCHVYTWIGPLLQLGFCVDGSGTVTLGIRHSRCPCLRLKLSPPWVDLEIQ